MEAMEAIARGHAGRPDRAAARPARARLVPVGGALVAAAHWVPSAAVLGQCGPFTALPGERCRWQGPRSSARKSDAQGVALTFDDGPDPEGTPRVP